MRFSSFSTISSAFSHLFLRFLVNFTYFSAIGSAFFHIFALLKCVLQVRFPSFSAIFKCVFLSAELGDFQPDLHTVEMVSEFRFVPSQNETMELHVFQNFQLMK
jgi:hypothetical protein